MNKNSKMKKDSKASPCNGSNENTVTRCELRLEQDVRASVGLVHMTDDQQRQFTATIKDAFQTLIRGASE